MRDVVENTIDSLKVYADKCNVRLFLNFDLQLPHFIHSDSVRTQQILLNLLNNAVKFSRSDNLEQPGQVELHLHLQHDGQLCIKVCDNGIGIPQEVISKLFNPFVQAEESTTRKFGGTGLGLVIVKKLVRLMGGKISVDSTFGQGTTFTVLLPIEKAEGQNKDPDISGLTVRALVMPNNRLEILKQYLEHDGVHISFFESQTQLVTAISASPGDSYVILGLHSIMDNKKAIEAISNNTSKTISFLSLVSNPAEDLTSKLPHCYAIQKYPILPSELKYALAQLSGRLSPDSFSNMASNAFETSSFEGSTYRVLLVEDNEVNQQVLTAQLKMLKLNVEVASNGAIALEKWKQSKYDLILTDCQMPEMDGFLMTKTLRKIEKKQNLNRIPVIAITASALQGEAERCISAGMDAYLSKPVEMIHLRKALVQWLL